MIKKNIAILGSTGSIGKTLLKIINKNKKDFNIQLLTANKNYKQILKQTKSFKVQNVIITDKNSYIKFIKINKNKNIKIYNNFANIKKIFKFKVDYIMSSIVGIDGLKPTLNVIEHTKTIAIANKESIICGWNLIKKELNKNNTEFIPVDSEHFSIWYGLKNNKDTIKNIYLTASGGPFLDLSVSKFKHIKLSEALNHPNWKMGKKITIDSATMMNKVFEIIEAKKIFNISYSQLKILIHPSSYIHAIIQYKNGLIKIIAHNTDMIIPINNTLSNNINLSLDGYNKLNFSKLNDLKLQTVNLKKFPLVKVINFLPKNNSLFETVVVSVNDELVNQFLQKKLNFTDINKKMIKILKQKEFLKYKNKIPKKVEDILELSNYVRSKIISKSI